MVLSITVYTTNQKDRFLPSLLPLLRPQPHGTFGQKPGAGWEQCPGLASHHPSSAPGQHRTSPQQQGYGMEQGPVF